MTFKFTYNEKKYDVKLTNGLVIDVEEAYEKPIDTMWHASSGGNASIMAKGKLAIYVGILNHLALRDQDNTLSTTLHTLKMQDDFKLNGKEVNDNCVNFFLSYIKQQSEFMKLGKGDGKAKKK